MLRQLLFRLRALVRRSRTERELEEEMRYHLERDAERLVASGVGRADARLAARRRIGHLPTIRDEARGVWVWRRLDELRSDVSYAFRSLRRSPGYLVVSILSLGIGIGATTTVFGLIEAADLRALPIREAQRLITMTPAAGPNEPLCPGCTFFVPRGLLELWEAKATSIDSFAAYGMGGDRFLEADGAVIEVLPRMVSPQFFSIVGVTPVIGRFFQPDDHREGPADAVLN